ncbi:hypothetical protein GF336_05245 [Candidatus Woesearchaeota archaeon]|nr:hypothetical protein [Candidatus Woesearchaeota archaeon]MBD3283330.1 hypothetical protein [Candidatus Pacearchaeota archaeon]
MVKNNAWTINKVTQSLYWFESLSSHKKTINEVLKVLENIEISIKDQKNIKISKGKCDLYIKDNKNPINPFRIDFVNSNTIKKEIGKKSMSEVEIQISDITLTLGAYLSDYDSRGKITKKWIDNLLEISIDNETDDFYVMIFNLSDIWLPQTWHSDKETGSKDNMELAMLNLPILNNLVKRLSEKLEIKFSVKDELSEKNKSLLNITSEGIKFKNEK